MSPRKPFNTILTPADPARSTGWPKPESALNRALVWGVSSKSGVPPSNVSLKVSCAAAAETIGGAVPVLVEGAGQVGDAIPDDVQLRVMGLGDVSAVVPRGPQALRRTNARMTIGPPARMRDMLVQRWLLQMITKRVGMTWPAATHLARVWLPRRLIPAPDAVEGL